MPYISKNARDNVDRTITCLIGDIQDVEKIGDGNLEGVVNYTLSRICNEVLIGDEPRYSKINAVIGVLEAVKLEFYRRLAGPYEDGAIEKNGDLNCYKNLEGE